MTIRAKDADSSARAVDQVLLLAYAAMVDDRLASWSRMLERLPACCAAGHED